MLKKFVISFFIAFSLLISVFVPYAKAQGTWYSQDFQQFYVTTFDDDNSSEIFGERYTAAQVQWILYSIPGHILTSITGGPEIWICIFSNDVGQCIRGAFEALRTRWNTILQFFGVSDAELVNPTGQKYANQNSNEALYDFFYNNPVSAVGMVLRGASKIHLVPEASAQGFVFRYGANTVLTLWKVTRNIAFSFLVLVVVVMAFMIMFRVKISPQAVVTLQSALPKIVMGIIFIALSYAIAGLLIDLMYVVIGIIALIINSSGLSNLSTRELFLDLTSHRNAFILCLQYLLDFLIGAIFTIFSASWFGGILALLVWIVLIFIALFNSVKILWVLLKTYVNILLLIIAAPFQILIGMIPGSTGGLGPWLSSMIANLAVYPVVGLLFFVSFMFLSPSVIINFPVMFAGVVEWSDFAEWLLPFNPNPQLLPAQTTWDPPLLGWLGNGGKFLYLMGSFAIFCMIPQEANMIKAFMEKKPFDYGSAIGEDIGTAATYGRGGLGWYAGKVEQKGIAAAGGGPYTSPSWIQALRSAGLIK